MSRVTERQLEARIEMLNKVAGQPPAPYIKIINPKGKAAYAPCGGAYYLDCAYNGYKLVQMNADGSENDTLGGGYVTKRELFDLINAFIRGIQAQQDKEAGA